MDEAIAILDKEIAELTDQRLTVLGDIQVAAREVSVWQDNVRKLSRKEENLGLKVERLITARDTLKERYSK